jgi:hypothetical protein
MQPLPKNWWFPTLCGCLVIVGFFRAEAFWRRTQILPESQRRLVRRVSAAAFLGTLSGCTVLLAYVIWSSSGSRVWFMIGVVALEVCLTCVLIGLRARSSHKSEI